MLTLASPGSESGEGGVELVHDFPSAIVEREMYYYCGLCNTEYTCGFVDTVNWDLSP